VADHNHNWVLKGDFDDLVAAMQSLQTKMGDMEARAAKAEAALDKLTKQKKAGADAAKKHGEALAGAEKILKTFGGSVASTTDTLFDLTEGMGKMGAGASVVGASVGAAVIAVGAFAYASKAMADASAAATERLVKQGLAAELPEGAEESVKDYRAAQAELAAALDLLTSAAGGPFVDALTEGMFALAGVTGVAVGAYDGIMDVWRAATGAAWAFSHLAPQVWIAEAAVFAVGKATELAAGKGRDMAELHKEAAEAAKGLAASELELKQALSEVEAEEDRRRKSGEEGEKLLAKRKEEAARKAAEWARKQAALEQEILRATEADAKSYEDKKVAMRVANHDSVEAFGEERKKLEEDINAAILADTASYYEKQANMRAANAENEKALEEDFRQRQQQMLQAGIDVTMQMAQAWTDMFVGLMEMEVQAIADELSALENRREVLRDLADQQREEHGEANARTKERLKNINEEVAAQQEALAEAFKVQQAAAIAAAVMQASVAFMGLMASMSFLTVGAPIAAAAIVGPALALQLAQIKNQKPPTFHDGGLAPDEIAANGSILRNGEASVVFNQRAVEMGAVERALDENRRPTNSASNRELVLTDAGRVIGRAVLREIERPDSALSGAFGSTSGQVEVGGRL